MKAKSDHHFNNEALQHDKTMCPETICSIFDTMATAHVPPW